jgi:hypothetical protein
MSANFLQKATGTSPTGLTDSLVFDNATDVGIGTASPTSQLHVTGQSRFDDTMELFPDQGVRIDVFSNPSSNFVRLATFRQGAATSVKAVAAYAGPNSSGQFGDMFIGRVDYASASLFNRVPSAKFGGTDNKFSTRGILIANYGGPAGLALRRSGTTPGGAGELFTDTGNATGVTSGTTVGIIYWQALDDAGGYTSQSDVGRSAQIACRVTENATPTARGAELILSTTANGTQSLAERMWIQQDGLVRNGSNDAAVDRVVKFRDADGSSLLVHTSGGGIDFCTDNSDLSPGSSVRMRVSATSFSASSAVYTAADGKTLTTVSPSSIEYKVNVREFEPELDHLFDLELRTFDWKRTGQRDFGFLAEEIAKCVPTLHKVDGHVIGWRADRFPLYLYQAIKNLKMQIDSLEQRRERH